MQYAEIFFHLNPRRKVTIAIPGFKTLSIPLDKANEFIEREWGAEYKLSPENESFSGQNSSEAIYNQLVDWGININKNLTVDFEIEITDSDELADFFIYLVEQEQEEKRKEEEEYEAKKEAGNPVALDDQEVDSFLQDIAQEYGELSYTDIMKFSDVVTEDELESLRNLLRKVERAVDDGYEIEDKEITNLLDKAIEIVKSAISRGKEGSKKVLDNIFDKIDSAKSEEQLEDVEKLIERYLETGRLSEDEAMNADFAISKTKEKLSSVSKEAGTWAVPYTMLSAKKLVDVVNTLKETGYISKHLHNVLGDDELFDDIGVLEQQIAEKIIDKVSEFLKLYKEHPDSFREQFTPEALKILEKLVSEREASTKQASTVDIHLIVQGGGDRSVGIPDTQADIHFTIEDNLIDVNKEELIGWLKEFFAEYYDVKKNVVFTEEELRELEKEEEKMYEEGSKKAEERIPADKPFQVTLWDKEITDDHKDKVIPVKYSIKSHPLTFRAYDDDGYFYAEGTVADHPDALESVFDYLQGGWGVTLVKFFKRLDDWNGRIQHGTYIDSIG